MLLNIHTILGLVVAVALSQAHEVLNTPGTLTASFSGSSSSSSAYSQSSSNSYSFNGNFDSKALEAFKGSLDSGAHTGATAAAVASATANVDTNPIISSVSSDCSSGTSCGGPEKVQADIPSISPYKAIGADNYATSYSSDGQTNYAVKNDYAQDTQNVFGGCISCKGQFPGPTGSIHEYKLAVNDVPSTQHNNQFPVAAGDIHTSIPIQTQYSNHISPSLIASFPGSSGSIYDSKPATAGAGAFANTGTVPAAHAGTATSTNTGTVSSANAGAFVHSSTTYTKPSTGPGLSAIISKLPGPTGSIYDSKPATVTVAQSSTGAHGSSESLSVTAKKPTKVASSSTSAHSSESSEETSSEHSSSSKPVKSPVSDHTAYSGAGSITNIPSGIHGPSCTFSLGAQGKCKHSESGEISQKETTAGSVDVNKNFEGSIGSIHDSKPAIVQGETSSSSSGSTSASHSSDLSVVGIVPTLIVPSIHPEVPPPIGTYYINKPSIVDEPPFVPSFSSQIPCSYSDCSTGKIVYEGKDLSGQYQSVKHGDVDLSGTIIFKNDDGTYSHTSTAKPTYKNAETGGYAISSNSADNKGVLIGPGTGFLPINLDHFQPYGALEGSAVLSKEYDNKNEVKTSQCTSCGKDENSQSETDSLHQSGYNNNGGSEQILVNHAEQTQKENNNEGFASGQVLVNQGGQTHDITNNGGNSGSYAQAGGYGFSGGLLNTLFGSGGFSGKGISGEHSSAGAYSSAEAYSGSYASAHASSYASG
ncbi:hypothetical protein ABEB36_012039 [Hypothenemus hampei]|uniref:Uncharacterized protein n=1 Tax=Hypothenemus hampei TaxID=57062 RepID=A0ABD1EE69_HYPHA